MKKNVVIPMYIIELPKASSLQKIVESLDKLNQPQTQTQTQAQSQGQNDNKPSLSEGLHDFDVHTLCQSQIEEVDVFDSDVEENLGQVDDEDSDYDDSEDSDFKEWQADGSEESDRFSFDKEDNLEADNESLDDIDLKNDTQLRMTLGRGSIDDDVGENLLIVNKMAKGIIKTLKVDDNTNNFVESFNNAIVKHRGKPTYTILEEIRKLIGARFDKRKLYDRIIHPIPDSCFWGDSELPALDLPFELRKRGRPEKHKRRKSRLLIHPQLSTIQLSVTKRYKKCKELGHNSITCGQPMNENDIFKYKKKPRKKTDNPVGRPRKIQRVSQASTSTAAASGVPTQSSQAI
ncbi:hypothetical protein Cgig2_001225 [Carnegiea gigantea]|uniref:Uncharacterized protein n=1 Tax=Carnegiea gigantea TaxID=171969 RepID=A0A9Q1JZT8_9CARY|nr:hypothetical protein Cgig2_001225 [Carnegiea gigantea]